METENDILIMRWRASQVTLANAKAQEAEDRAAVIAALFNGHKDEGTENVELGGGYKLKATFGLSYTLVNKEGETDAALEAMPPFIAGRLVRWKPELSVSEYRELTDEQKAAFDGALTIKPKMPALELVEPKGKK